jgi:hypothetical protein
VTAAGVPVAARPLRPGRVPSVLPGRLLRLELRRSPMLWLVPVAAAFFWFDAYRNAMTNPPLWGLRVATMQVSALLDFVPPVVGAAAWVGSRERRRHIADLLAVTARPRWARQLAAWAAIAGWAVLAYLICTGVLYGVTAGQGAWGGPPLWPVAVGTAGVVALSAVGFAVGALIPSRFTAPLAAVGLWLAAGLSSAAAHFGDSYGQISPANTGVAGPSSWFGIFYHYLPDLSMAQVLFLAGLGAAALGTIGLPAASGGRWLRGGAAVLAVAGLAAAGTGIALAGTARLDSRSGMTMIPALHDAASDRPVPYTPVCSHTAIPVCVHPAYQAFLPGLMTALRPVISEVGGLPGAPARVAQVSPSFQPAQATGINISGPAGCADCPPGPGSPARGSSSVSGSPPASGGRVIPLLLALPLPGQSADGRVVTTAEFAGTVQSIIAPEIVYALLAPAASRAAQGPAGPARAAVAAALLKDAGVPPLSDRQDGFGAPGSSVPGPAPGSPAYAAAQRFAALPAAARHAWLVRHLAALRAGRITLAQLP